MLKMDYDNKTINPEGYNTDKLLSRLSKVFLLVLFLAVITWPIMAVTFRGENITVTGNIIIPEGSGGKIILEEFSTSAVGGALVVKRSNADGALFGIQNDIAGANPTSGAGYIWITDAGNYTLDAHSSQDSNDPNEVVHHLRGDINNEHWRTNPFVNESFFSFEDGLNTPIFKINSSGFIQVGRSGNVFNITMFSPDNTEFTCGVDNAGTFTCS